MPNLAGSKINEKSYILDKIKKLMPTKFMINKWIDFWSRIHKIKKDMDRVAIQARIFKQKMNIGFIGNRVWEKKNKIMSCVF